MSRCRRITFGSSLCWPDLHWDCICSERNLLRAVEDYLDTELATWSLTLRARLGRHPVFPASGTSTAIKKSRCQRRTQGCIKVGRTGQPCILPLCGRSKRSLLPLDEKFGRYLYQAVEFNSKTMIVITLWYLELSPRIRYKRRSKHLQKIKLDFPSIYSGPCKAQSPSN